MSDYLCSNSTIIYPLDLYNFACGSVNLSISWN